VGSGGETERQLRWTSAIFQATAGPVNFYKARNSAIHDSVMTRPFLRYQLLLLALLPRKPLKFPYFPVTELQAYLLAQDKVGAHQTEVGGRNFLVQGQRRLGLFDGVALPTTTFQNPAIVNQKRRTVWQQFPGLVEHFDGAVQVLVSELQDRGKARKNPGRFLDPTTSVD